MSRARRSGAFAGIAAIVIVVGAAWVWLNRQYLQDWMVVQNYTPSAEVAAITQRATMNQQGTFLFYASQPQISDAATFNQQCTRRETSTAILGCYDGLRIYLYNVSNDELDGIKEVTAAHEMLHAAWQRLSDSERTRLGALLEQAYDKVKTPALEERMAYYERQQPGERANELHSILGTESGDLGEDLEHHFAQYFTDRQEVVRLHARYEAVFTSLQQQAEALRQEIETMVTTLNQDIAAHNQAVMQLDQDIIAHNNSYAALDRTDAGAVNAYNARRSNLMARGEALDQQERQLDVRREQYNQKLQQYNQLAIRAETLTDSVDSVKTQATIEK